MNKAWNMNKAWSVNAILGCNLYPACMYQRLIPRSLALARHVQAHVLSMGGRHPDPAIAGRMRAAQIAGVMGYTPVMLLANIAGVAGATCVLWSGRYGGAILIWAAVILGMAGRMYWNQQRAQGRAIPSSVSLRGIRRAVLYAAVMGGVWGAMPLLFYLHAEPEQKMVIIALGAGIMAISTFSLATIPAAALTFAGMVWLGALFALLRDGSMTALMLIALNTVFLMMMWQGSKSLSIVLSERILAQIASDEQRDVIGLLLNDFEANASDWLWVTDRDLCIQHVSARYYQMMQCTEADVVGQGFLTQVTALASRPTRYSNRGVLRELTSAMQAGQPFRDIEIEVMVGRARHVWSLTAKPVFGPKGEFNGYRGVGRDITRDRAARERIDFLARHDALTGLANRVLFREVLDKALIRLERRGETFALFLLDLDHFKVINDTQGHPVGDALLRAVSQRLQQALPQSASVARLGGDEFAIVLPAVCDSDQARIHTHQIIEMFAVPFELDTGNIAVGVTMGVALAPVHGSDADTLMRHADLALYKAKSAGRGGFFIFAAELDRDARRRHMLEADLRSAVGTDELVLNYQPIFCSASGSVCTFEALMRWDHPVLGRLSPVEFIPIAEETGLICRMGAHALRRACHDAMGWPDHINVAVNLSPAQFRSPSLFVAVQAALEASGIDPKRLELEITESILMDAQEQVLATIAAIKALGVRFALDDFGTGYSSLSYLRKYPVDKIKIDRAFIRDIENDRSAQAIISTIIQLAATLGMALTVEDVETPGQLALLEAMGCAQFQGFLLGKPTAAHDLARFFNLQMQSVPSVQLAAVAELRRARA